MTVTILTGHVIDKLAGLPDESVHCCVTSPPYFGLRSYGTPPQVWGGDKECEHEWGSEGKPHHPGQVPDGKAVHAENAESQTKGFGKWCSRCGAWRGDLGLEPSVDLFIEHLVYIFRQVRRVLRSDGTFFCNIGDSFCSNGGAGGAMAATGLGAVSKEIMARPEAADGAFARWRKDYGEAKNKDLLMIPAILALALRADGWWLRSEIIWAKTAPMPESVLDRPTCAHEKVFLFAKSSRYFYDSEAVKEKAVSDHGSGNGYVRDARLSYGGRGSDQPWAPHGQSESDYGRLNNRQDELHNRIGRKGNAKTFRGGSAYTQGRAFDNSAEVERESHGNKPNTSMSRNMRNFWLLGPEPFPDAHFATFVSEIPRRAILAGTSEKGVCSACGAPWKRQTKTTRTRDGEPLEGSCPVNEGGVRIGASGVGHWRDKSETETLRWESTCKCDGVSIVPATILDPFAGAFTTSLVANRLGRNSISIELNPDYVRIGRARLQADAGMFYQEAAE